MDWSVNSGRASMGSNSEEPLSVACVKEDSVVFQEGMGKGYFLPMGLS